MAAAATEVYGTPIFTKKRMREALGAFHRPRASYTLSHGFGTCFVVFPLKQVSKSQKSIIKRARTVIRRARGFSGDGN